jgi:transposase
VIDAEAAARAVLSGRAAGTPKSRDAQVEMIRALRVARRGAMKARIQAGGQVDALIVSAPQIVRQSLRGLAGKHRIRGCAALRPGPITDPAAAATKNCSLERCMSARRLPIPPGASENGQPPKRQRQTR